MALDDSTKPILAQALQQCENKAIICLCATPYVFPFANQ
ncbi:hypothetical protein PAMC26510_13130 [Caballeronia sordidicola]|uniref:Uncharacterized protein n=1 Tax=Caballeronia sordidicola TaxID=196367 RepID=A0A242MW89_CABSO|nr:hypothetical protein PAMC26510_13130 [Caballeronia sordidicola]